MGASKKAAKAQKAAGDAWTNPYVQRIVQDEELRDNVRVAYDSARKAFARLSNGKATTKVLDALFGAEEEFDYTSTTSPPAPATSTAANN